MDIGAWLRGLGLGQYEQAFRDNDLDAEVLPELAEADLEKLGVTSLGHRKRLLKAIAALREGALPSGAPSSRTEPPIAAPGPASRPAEAERRQLTVMFVDLVGSTALSTRLDPEDMREVIRAYQDAVAGEVARFEGHVAKFMGDGVLAYFGFPQAHEDDAERAVRAGLDMLGTVGRLRSPEGEPLAARVGIATGLVVVGDLVGSGPAQERAVVGETPNLAARLQALAEPGAVVIAQATRQLVGGLFECADLGARRVKGFAGPVRAWCVLGPSGAEGRFEALHGTSLSPLVGREAEIALLLDRWRKAKEGEGQVVLLAGEPGIGKSRLVEALRQQLGGEPHGCLRYYGSPYHRASALHPVIAQLERAAALERDDPPERKLDKLEALLARSGEHVAAVAPLVAALLSIPTGARYPTLAVSPQRQKAMTLEALAAQLAGLAARRPVLLVWEDAHWSDPTSLELLGLTVDRVQAMRVLVVVAFRPEFVPPWTGYPHVTALTLARLGRRQAAAIVGQLAGGRALPAEVLDRIVARTDGVPLFVEELTKTVLEAGLLEERGDRYTLAEPLPPLAIPSTLHDSLMARLDRLSPVKEVAQVAAVIGREFSHELLAAAAPLSEDDLRGALAQLCRSELVFRRGTPPEATYSFKHALVRDAAYGSLLRGRRQQLHARIAAVLEERFPGVASSEPELLAQHFAEAGLAEKAAEYWHRAGRLAAGKSAMAEALAHLRHALAQLEALPRGGARAAKELELQTALGGVLIAARGYAAPETGEAFARARALLREVGASERLFPVLYGQSVYRLVRGEVPEARRIAGEMLRLAEERRDAAPLPVARRVMGVATFFLGRPAEARTHLEEALAVYDFERHGSLALPYAFDHRVAVPSYLALTLWQLGYPDRAAAQNEEALARARELGHPMSLAYALQHACFLQQLRGDAEALASCADALLALATEQAFPYWSAYATFSRGLALTWRGQAEEGLEAAAAGIDAFRALGAELGSPQAWGLLGRAYGRAGRPGEGLELIEQALAAAREHGEAYCEAELHRLRGELLAASPRADREAAEACFRRATVVAREQGARMWELRAATDLARLYVGRAGGGEAHRELAAIYRWFSEGFDTPDLREAGALLGHLTSSPLRSEARSRHRSASVNNPG